MSAVRLSQAAIPVMRRGGSGSIVNLASLTGQQPIDGIALSNASRPALIGLAKTLSREAAPEVPVNDIATEPILTDRIRDLAAQLWPREGESPEEIVQRVALDVPLKRCRDPRGAGQRGGLSGQRRRKLHHRGDVGRRRRPGPLSLLGGGV